MKIKLLAVSVFVLALGINTAEAQHRRNVREHSRYENRHRGHGDFSKGNRHKEFGYQRGDGRHYRQDRKMRNRHRNEFGRHGRTERKFNFHKRHHNRHSF